MPLRLGGLLTVAAFPAMIACEPSADLRLQDGRNVKDMVSPDSTIVLLYNPADCMRCDPDMPLWLEYSTLLPDRFLLLLTRTPSDSEREQLVAMQVAARGTIKSHAPWNVLRGRGSRLLLFVGQRRVAAHALAEQGPIKDMMRRGLESQLGTPDSASFQSPSLTRR